MSRILTGHHINPANDVLKIEVLDPPGSGGAHHQYGISGFRVKPMPKPTIAELEKLLQSEDDSPVSINPDGSIGVSKPQLVIGFQNGPIAEAGVNGITHEALLAILIDRLECFQAGPYASSYNEQALIACRAAQEALLSRTRSRMARGVEGAHTV